VPKILKPDSSLVMVFHGYESSAEEISEYSGFKDLFNEEGFVVAYPQGIKDSFGNRFYNVGYDFHSY